MLIYTRNQIRFIPGLRRRLLTAHGGRIVATRSTFMAAESQCEVALLNRFAAAHQASAPRHQTVGAPPPPTLNSKSEIRNQTKSPVAWWQSIMWVAYHTGSRVSSLARLLLKGGAS